MKDASSTPAADDDSDCVTSTGYGTCATPTSNAPTGRRRRAILSKRMRRSDNGNSDNFKIDFSQCGETATDADGIVTCVQPKSNAKTASLAVLTGALVCALH